MQGVNFTAYQKRRALKLWLIEKLPIEKVCQTCKCNERSLWRWKKLYDGTLDSLQPKLSRKHIIHPNAHTSEEVEHIVEVLGEEGMSYCEAFGILREKYAYSRSFGGFYNFVIKHNIRPRKSLEKYIPKPYDTPEMFGTKIQIDVKYVPKECYKGDKEVKFYQYTAIDEATRERFLFPYTEHCVNSTLDFVKRAICFFGYIPDIIQTDNGGEFTYHKEKHYKDGKTITTKKKHALDLLCEQLKIKHQLIRAYTPRLNGKVERSHRTDQEMFYNYLEFETLAELKNKMMLWNQRYNNKPHSSLKNREGKRVWWTPNQKRQDLFNLLQEKKAEYEIVRFIKMQKPIQVLYA